MQRGKFQGLDDVPGQRARTQANNGVGITRRRVSQDENDFYTDPHIKPTDWKRPDLTRRVHADALRNGRVLATGVSNTANIHISGMYQLGLSSVMTGHGEPLNKKEMRRYTEMVINTMCLDGGHSRWEVLKGVNNLSHLMEKNMGEYYQIYGGPENNKVRKFDEDFIKSLKDIAPDALVKGGLEYDLHYKKLRQEGTIDPADQINAFVNALTQLRNGSDAKKHDLMQLRARNTVPSNPSIHKFPAEQSVPLSDKAFKDMSNSEIRKLTKPDLANRRTKSLGLMSEHQKKYLTPEIRDYINQRIDSYNKRVGRFSPERMRHF
jgi:hypothetical protein